MRQPATAALQILVSAVPDAALRPLLIELLLLNGAAPSASANEHKRSDDTEPAAPGPVKRGGGWPRGKPRGRKVETEAERTARLARHAAAQRVRDTEKRRQKRAAAQLGLPTSRNSNGGNGAAHAARQAKP